MIATIITLFCIICAAIDFIVIILNKRQLNKIDLLIWIFLCVLWIFVSYGQQHKINELESQISYLQNSSK